MRTAVVIHQGTVAVYLKDMTACDPEFAME